MTEFADRSDLPQLFFTATRLASPGEELARLAKTARHSTLPGAQLFDGITLDNWQAALHQVAAALPDGPTIVVLDEFPWLAESSPSLEGALQTVWDRVFESMPVCSARSAPATAPTKR